jgi:hypothetical protein
VAQEGSVDITPRTYGGTAVMLGSVTALPFALVLSWLLAAIIQRPFGEVIPIGLGAGLLFGVLFGLTMAFFLKGETAAVKYIDEAAFLSRLNVAVSQLGYNPASQSERFFTFKPSFQAGLAAGRIAVQLQEGEAVIVGPKVYVRRLVKQFGAG